MPLQSKNNTLLILLGAQAFPLFPALQSAAAFKNSYAAVKNYFTAPDGFGLSNSDNVLDLFDSELNSLTQYSEITDWLEHHLKTTNTQSERTTDLFMYYVGHGGFGDHNDSYYLAIRATRKYDPFTYSIQISALANILRTYAAELRRFLLIDACFAAAAVEHFQSPLDQVIKKKV